MTKKILLLGVLDSVLADTQRQVERPDLEVFRGTSVEDVRATLARTNIDHVFMGGKLPLETRLEMAREIFQSSDTTFVHMKEQSNAHLPDPSPGPQGFLPFVLSVLHGVIDNEE